MDVKISKEDMQALSAIRERWGVASNKEAAEKVLHVGIGRQTALNTHADLKAAENKKAAKGKKTGAKKGAKAKAGAKKGTKKGAKAATAKKPAKKSGKKAAAKRAAKKPAATETVAEAAE